MPVVMDSGVPHVVELVHSCGEFHKLCLEVLTILLRLLKIGFRCSGEDVPYTCHLHFGCWQAPAWSPPVPGSGGTKQRYGSSRQRLAGMTPAWQWLLQGLRQTWGLRRLTYRCRLRNEHWSASRRTDFWRSRFLWNVVLVSKADHLKLTSTTSAFMNLMESEVRHTSIS